MLIMKYIIRKDNIPEMSNNYGEEVLDEKLKSDYQYILDSMEVEGYRIRFNDFSFFSEILYEGKVVGFVTYQYLMGNNLTMNEIYILPDFRGNNLFLDEIIRIIMSGATLSFNEPTRQLVEILIHAKFAVKLTDNLVATAFGFDISDEHLLHHGDFDLGDGICSASLYDLSICSPLYLQDISTLGVCNIAYQKVLEWDDMHYDCRKARDSMDMDEYFNEFKINMLVNNDEYVAMLKGLKDNLPRGIMNYETVFGDGEGLSDYMKSLVDDGALKTNEALRLIKQLKREYEKGLVSDEGLITRLSYLMAGIDLSKEHELFLENISKTRDLCPYCYQPVNLTDNYCMICGCDISDGELLDYDKVIEEITQGNDHVIDLRGDKLDEFISDDDEILVASNDMNRRLFEIYKNNDEEAFSELLDEYSIGISEISEIENLEDREIVDLSHYFEGEPASYMKNYYASCRVIDMDKPVKKHFLNENTTPKRNPTYSMRMALMELEKNPNLDESLDSADINIEKNSLKKILFDYGLIESKIYGEDFWMNVYENYNVSELKEILRKNHLKLSGNKIELVLRLKENNLYSEFEENEFQLTEDGEYLLSGSQWIEIYEQCMDYFDLDDLENYMMDHNSIDFIQNAINYLNEHLKIAYQRKDFHRLHDVFSAKSFLYLQNEEFKKALTEELHLYMLRLNPVFLSPEELESYEAMEYSNINNIGILSIFSNVHNLKKIFNKTWRHMKFTNRLISKKMSLKYLNRAVGGEDLEELSLEISEKYFKN